MTYMVIEHFRPGHAPAIYARLRDSGRMMPEGVGYVSSWITPDLTACWQVMECQDRRLLDEWMSHWSDLMTFEVVPVISSAAAAAQAQLPGVSP